MLWRAVCIRERFVPSPRSGMPLGKRVSVLPKEDKSVADGPCRFAGKGPSPNEIYKLSPCKRSRASVVSSSLPKAVKRT